MNKHEVVIVGLGLSGLAAYHYFRNQGFTDIAVLEQAEDLGGTWRDNSYPGSSCDVDSSLYSLSFAPHNWQRSHAEQPEILDYTRQVAIATGALAATTFECELISAEWQPSDKRWQLRTTKRLSGGTHPEEIKCRYLVIATGPLSKPLQPDLPGVGSFTGEIRHTASWQPLDWRGRDVAVVGTGASSAQVVPAMATEARSLTVFQRTPAWVLPRRGQDYSARKQNLRGRVPLIQKWERRRQRRSREIIGRALTEPAGSASWVLSVARWRAQRLLATVSDPITREALTPDYPIGCKRIVQSDDFIDSFNRDNVHLVASAASHFVGNALHSEDSRASAPLDAVVFATGFAVWETALADRVVGTSGTTLGEYVATDTQAYAGGMYPDFPNLFQLLGPNTGIGHTSVLLQAEAQARFFARLAQAADRWKGVAQVGEALTENFNRALQRDLADSVWGTGNCNSWYQHDGKIAAIWPGSTQTFAEELENAQVARLIRC